MVVSKLSLNSRQSAWLYLSCLWLILLLFWKASRVDFFLNLLRGSRLNLSADLSARIYSFFFSHNKTTSAGFNTRRTCPFDGSLAWFHLKNWIACPTSCLSVCGMQIKAAVQLGMKKIGNDWYKAKSLLVSYFCLENKIDTILSKTNTTLIFR